MQNKLFRIERKVITYQVKEVVAKTKNDAITMVEEQGDLGWTENSFKSKVETSPNRIRLIARLGDE